MHNTYTSQTASSDEPLTVTKLEFAMKQQQGFTIIELMAVVSIISILTVIVLAVYSDYIVRTKVSEGMAFVGEAKGSVSEYYYNTKSMPEGNSQAGLSDPDDYNKFQYIRRLEIATQPKPGTIVVTFKIPNSPADNRKLELVPSTSNGVVYWTCQPTSVGGINVTQVPPNCRG